MRNLTSFVDLTKGAVAPDENSRSHGKISLGPSMPFGVIIVQPQTAPHSTQTGYNRFEKLSGFTNVNCESTYKYGNLLVSPQIGLDSRDPGNGLSTGHDSEKAHESIRVGYYSADLVRYGIKAEVTTGRNSALYRFTYPNTDQACVLIDPSHNPLMNGVDYGDPLFTSVNCDPQTGTVTGYLDVLGGWQLTGNIRIYFAAALSGSVTAIGLSQCDGTVSPGGTTGSG